MNKILVKCSGSDLVPVASIHSIQGRLKRISKESMEKLKGSLKTYGFRFPVFAWKHNGRYLSIDGVHRVLAMEQLAREGWETPERVPVALVDAEDETEAKRLLLVASSRYAEIEKDYFQEFFSDLGMSYDELLEVAEFPEVAIELLAEESSEIFGLDKPPRLPAQPQSILGDIYRIECEDSTHTIMCGNSADPRTVEALIPRDRSVELLITDPPFGIDYTDRIEKLKKRKVKAIRANKHRQNSAIHGDSSDVSHDIGTALLNLKPKLTEYSSYYIFFSMGSNALNKIDQIAEAAGFPVRHVIVWDKTRPIFCIGRMDYQYRHELIMYGWANKHRFYGKGRFKTTVWSQEYTRSAKAHPTMKPVELLEDMILNSSARGDSVVDPFLGSGSTTIACMKQARNSYGIEIDPGYVDVSVSRAWQYATSAGIAKSCSKNGETLKLS